MGGIDILAEKIVDIFDEPTPIIEEKKEVKIQEGLYDKSNHKVIIDKVEYDCELSSADIRLYDGCKVYCIATEEAGKVLIVGSGY